MRRRWHSSLGLAGGLILALSACRGEDLTVDCENQLEDFEAVAESEATLYTSVPEWEPYPAAIKFSQEGINKLLDAVVGEEVPFTGELPFGPTTISFEPFNEPTIELLDAPGCNDCIVMSMDFRTTVVDPLTGPVASGIGDVKMTIPLTLEPEGEEFTALVAHYEQADIIDMTVSVFGLDGDEHAGLAGALQTLINQTIQESYGPTELFKLQPWALGDGSIKLMARDIVVYPDEGVLLLALQTNLVLEEGEEIVLEPELNMDVPMGMEMHVGLLEAIGRRMLVEGVIPRRYDDDGNPDEDGTYGVTFESIEGNDEGTKWLSSEFRIWRVADGYCGYAVVEMPIAIENDDFDVDVEPGNVVVIDGRGSGAAAAEEEQLVEDNQHLADTFKVQLAEQLDQAINYEGLDIEGSRVVFTTLGAAVRPDAIATELDFVVVAAPDEDP